MIVFMAFINTMKMTHLSGQNDLMCVGKFNLKSVI